jgi:secondary thiamine-phosphate synthase enzyme
MLRWSRTITTTTREQLFDITASVADLVANKGDGIATVFVPHTTAAVTINENADADVQADILAWLGRAVPLDPTFRHAEGNSDAHIKAMLVGATVQVPVYAGRLDLGTWQAIYFCEFDGPRQRQVVVTLTT